MSRMNLRWYKEKDGKEREEKKKRSFDFANETKTHSSQQWKENYKALEEQIGALAGEREVNSVLLCTV